MLQLENKTPFIPSIAIFPDERGVDTLYVAVKATFEIYGGELRVAAKQCPLLLADEYWDEPGASSLKYANEAHLLKPGTDVVVVGDAHAPGGRPVASLLAQLAVGPLRSSLQIFGDRHWTVGLASPWISSPEPFVRMPLRYERAYGGLHPREPGKGEVLSEPRNPVGRGFRGQRGASEMMGRPLPNLEDPRALIQHISDAPAPVGMGYVAPSWLPRKGFAGTYDEAWRTQRAPYLPLDFKPDFFRAASPGLRLPGFFQGGEPVALLNLSPEGALKFLLPRCELEVTAQVAGRREAPLMRMETVLLEPGVGRMCLLWRGAVPCDKRALKVERVCLRLKSLEGVVGGA